MLRASRAICICLGWGTLLGPVGANAQSNTRLLLESGWGVPGHAGFVFGPFSSLAMNEAKDLVLLSSLRSSRKDLRAVVRSSGVTFSVMAFEGLKSPVPKTTYTSFSAPSLNNAGVIAFTAALKDEKPLSAVIRVEGTTAWAVVTTESTVPGQPDASFLEFSPPLVTLAGHIIFAARIGGKQPGGGLFLWTPTGIRPVPLPPEMSLGAEDMLTPVFFGHDAAVFAPRRIPVEAVTEQFFRAAAIKSFEDLKPPPAPTDTFEALGARADEKPVKMLLVLVESGNVQTEVLQGDPSRPVMAKRVPGVVLKPLGRMNGQTSGPRGNIIFSAAPADQPTDVGLYCLCDGQMIRLTTPEEFAPVVQAAGGKPITSLVSDSQQTTAFIAPVGTGPDSNAIYVTSVP